MRSQPDAGRVVHRIQGAALPVRERLHPSQEEQRGGRRPATSLAGGSDGAVGSHVHTLDIRMNRWRGIGRIEERLPEAIGRAGAGEAFVQKYGTIGNCLVELGEGW